MQKMAVWGLLVLYLLWACCSPVTSLFISPTTEVSGNARCGASIFLYSLCC